MGQTHHQIEPSPNLAVPLGSYLEKHNIITWWCPVYCCLCNCVKWIGYSFNGVPYYFFLRKLTIPRKSRERYPKLHRIAFTQKKNNVHHLCNASRTYYIYITIKTWFVSSLQSQTSWLCPSIHSIVFVGICTGHGHPSPFDCTSNAAMENLGRLCWRVLAAHCLGHLLQLVSVFSRLKIIVLGSKLPILGLKLIPPLIVNPYYGYLNPYYWVEFPIPMGV